MVVDYYEMLGIAPNSDRATIEAALTKAQPVWSAGTRNPKNKHRFQSYLDAIPALRRTLLGEPSLRAAYDAEIAEAHRAERDRKLDDLQRLVKIRASKGGLTVTDREILRAEATRLGLAHADFDRLAAPFPPMPEAPIEPESSEEPPDVIEPATRRQIRITLEHLRRRDLYDVLNLPRDAPLREISNRADAERQRWMQKSQVTAEKTAWLEAVSYAQSNLSTPDSRARYDRTLALEAEETLQATIQFAIRNTSLLADSTRHFLREEALGLGITADRAEKLIDRLCRSAGVGRGESGKGTIRGPSSVRYLRCRSCAGLTEFALASRSETTAVCHHCRASLQWKCPVCQRMRWVDEPRCACDFRLEHAEPLIRYFEAANHAHKVRDLDSALEALRKVQEFAPQHVGARKGIERIKETQAEIDRARNAVESEIARHHLMAAQAAISGWTRLVDPSLPALRKAMAEVSEGLRRARQFAARGRALATSDPAASREAFGQALSICADLPEALSGLRVCPPEPPSGLVAFFEVDRVKLRWNAPLPDGLGPWTFRIRRKRGAIPAHVDDGDPVAEVAPCSHEDADAPSGASIGYAVFTSRGGISSILGATAGPIPILAEVSHFRAEASSREVLLSWEPPANSAEVRLVRKVGSPPSDFKDGVLVPSMRGQALDRGLDDDRVYHYGAFSIYQSPGEPVRVSRGVAVSAMPSAPISAIVEPSLTRQDDGPIRVSWSPPQRGKVVVIRSLRALPHAPGDRLARKDVDAVEGVWLTRTADDHAIDRRPLETGVCHYTAMISWANQYVVGRSAAYSHVCDPSDLRAVRSGKAGKVLLRWRWSPRGGKARIVYRQGSFPVQWDDPQALSSTVDELEFSRLGYYPLMLPPDQPGPWHVAVYTVVTVEGREIVSPGLDPSSRTIVPGPLSDVSVSYTLRPPSLFLRTWTVQFRTEPPGATIPPTVLVAHPRTVPLSADDGETVAVFPAASDGEQFSIRTNLDTGTHRMRIFTDPHATLENMPPIRLRHPEAEGTRV